MNYRIQYNVEQSVHTIACHCHCYYVFSSLYNISNIIKYTTTKEFQFIPIAIETLGPVGEDATRFLQELGRRIKAVTRD